MRAFLNRLWPTSIVAQISWVLVTALVFVHLLIFALFHFFSLPRPEEWIAASAAARIGMAARVLNSQAPADRRATAAALTDAGNMISIDPSASAPSREPPSDESFAALIRAEAGPAARAIMVLPATQQAPKIQRVLVQLLDGAWIEFRIKPLKNGRGFLFLRILILATIIGVAVGWLAIWATRRLTAPLSALTEATEGLGTGVPVPKLAERGPLEVARAARTFNEMRDRIRRFIDDRTHMLAAISHDLRTPLTRLRLRIEAEEPEPGRQRMLADVTALERLINSALAFLRDQSEADAEKVIPLDLAALLQTLCDDAADAGHEACYEGLLHCIVAGRQDALTRAFQNLLDNAHRYAGAVIVRLTMPQDAPRFVRVDVVDTGMGIPDCEKGRVFETFYRVDSARSTDTGGMGLGLATVRSVIHAHGGDIQLLDNRPQGLIVRVQVPLRDRPPAERAMSY